jgi:hypothetical protein
MSIATISRGQPSSGGAACSRTNRGAGRLAGSKASWLSVLCRSYGAWLTSATAGGYKHGAPPELARGALTAPVALIHDIIHHARISDAQLPNHGPRLRERLLGHQQNVTISLTDSCYGPTGAAPMTTEK